MNRDILQSPVRIVGQVSIKESISYHHISQYYGMLLWIQANSLKADLIKISN